MQALLLILRCTEQTQWFVLLPPSDDQTAVVLGWVNSWRVRRCVENCKSVLQQWIACRSSCSAVF